jgi:hypothetical protein
MEEAFPAEKEAMGTPSARRLPASGLIEVSDQELQRILDLE